MTAKKYLDYVVREIHTTVVATVDDRGLPVTVAIDMMDSDEQGLYFLTAKGKDTLSCVAVSLRGKVRELGYDRVPDLFEKNPCMHELYPTEAAMKVLSVFPVYEGCGEWFDLSEKPIERDSFAFGGAAKVRDGFFIAGACAGCGSCVAVCPLNCIRIDSVPYEIEQEHCLHCGNCLDACPVKAVERM